MDRRFLLLLLVFASSFSVLFANTKLENKAKINYLQQYYSKPVILKAIDQVLEHDGYGLSIIEKEDGYNYTSYDQKVETMINGYPNILDIAFANVTRKQENSKIINHIVRWCHIYVLINQYIELSPSPQVEQLLSEISTCEQFVESYENGVSVFSEEQLVELPYKLTNYLYSKSDEELLTFYKEFQSKIFELSASIK